MTAAVTAVWAGIVRTAASPAPAVNPGDNPNHVGPGPVAFIVVVGLGVALFFLVRSMGHQMRKVNFDDGSQDPKPPAADPPITSQPGSAGSGQVTPPPGRPSASPGQVSGRRAGASGRPRQTSGRPRPPRRRPR